MASMQVWIGAALLLLLVGLGVYQNALPHSTLAGAVPATKTQTEINICMNDCMRGCVLEEGMEQPCNAECETKCVG